MKKRVYLMLASHMQSTGIPTMLSELGGHVVFVDRNEVVPDELRQEPYDLFVLYVLAVEEGMHFPCKHMRIFSPLDPVDRQLPVPIELVDFVTETTTLVAVRDCQKSRHDRMKNPLRDLHFRDHRNSGRWLGERRKSPSRAARSRRFMAKHAGYALT